LFVIPAVLIILILYGLNQFVGIKSI